LFMVPPGSPLPQFFALASFEMETETETESVSGPSYPTQTPLFTRIIIFYFGLTAQLGDVCPSGHSCPCS
jgi:hypothetical protein